MGEKGKASKFGEARKFREGRFWLRKGKGRAAGDRKADYDH